MPGEQTTSAEERRDGYADAGATNTRRLLEGRTNPCSCCWHGDLSCGANHRRSTSEAGDAPLDRCLAICASRTAPLDAARHQLPPTASDRARIGCAHHLADAAHLSISPHSSGSLLE